MELNVSAKPNYCELFALTPRLLMLVQRKLYVNASVAYIW